MCDIFSFKGNNEIFMFMSSYLLLSSAYIFSPSSDLFFFPSSPVIFPRSSAITPLPLVSFYLLPLISSYLLPSSALLFSPSSDLSFFPSSPFTFSHSSALTFFCHQLLSFPLISSFLLSLIISYHILLSALPFSTALALTFSPH